MKVAKKTPKIQKMRKYIIKTAKKLLIDRQSRESALEIRIEEYNCKILTHRAILASFHSFLGRLIGHSSLLSQRETQIGVCSSATW